MIEENRVLEWCSDDEDEDYDMDDFMFTKQRRRSSLVGRPSLKKDSTK